MRSRSALAVVALVIGSVPVVSAQYSPYESPALLPLPAVHPVAGHPAYSSAPYQARQPQSAHVRGVAMTPGEEGTLTPPEPPPSAEPLPPSAVDELGTIYDEAMGSPLADGGSGPCATGCCDGCKPLWFGYLGGLVMSRDEPDEVYLTYPNVDPPGILSTKDASAESDWRGGFEVRLGRRFGCDRALEVVYWTLDPFASRACVDSATNEISSRLDFTGVTLNGNAAQDYFTDNREHHVWRRNEFHNIEINLLHMPVVCDRSHGFNLSWLLGARYFRFDEGLIFGASEDWLGVDPSTEAYYDIDVVNNLIGLQLGAAATWMITPRWSIFAAPRAGLFANHIEHESRLFDGNGVVGFDIESNKDDVSMLAQLDVGLNFQITPAWFAVIGYRAVGVAGLALSDDQIPVFIGETETIADVNSNGSLILHGGFAGIGVNF